MLSKVQIHMQSRKESAMAAVLKNVRYKTQNHEVSDKRTTKQSKQVEEHAVERETERAKQVAEHAITQVSRVSRLYLRDMQTRFAEYTTEQATKQETKDRPKQVARTVETSRSRSNRR